MAIAAVEERATIDINHSGRGVMSFLNILENRASTTCWLMERSDSKDFGLSNWKDSILHH